MKSKYWITVGKRFASLSKTALQTAVPVVLDSTIILVIDKITLVIKSKLSSIYKKSLINSIINFLLNLTAIGILYFRPFSSYINMIIAGLFFLSAFIFWLIRFIQMIIQYGYASLEIAKNTCKKHNLYKGIEVYILDKFPEISFAYTGIDIGKQYIPALSHLPKISELVRFYVHYFWKQISLFIGIMSIYTISVYWIIKPIILRKL